MVKKLKQTSLVKATENVSEAAQPYEMYGGADGTQATGEPGYDRALSGADGTQTEGEPASVAQGEEAPGEYAEDSNAGTEPELAAEGDGDGTDPEGQPPAGEPQPEHDQTVTDMSNSENNLVRQMGVFLKAVDRIGGEKGAGDKSMVSLVERVLEASSEGVIDGGDASKVYDRFRDAAAKKLGNFAAPEQAKGTYKAQVSKLRQIIECGRVEGAKEVFEMARERHVQLMKSEDKGMLREKGTYGALVSIAREQLKDKYQVRAKDGRTPAALTEDEILAVLIKPEDDNEPDTAFDVVVQALKKVELALEGRKETESRPAMEPLMDVNNPDSKDEHLLEAREYLKQVIANHDPEYFSKIEAEANAKKAEAEEKAKRKAEADAEKIAKKAIADAEKAAAKAKAEAAKAQEAAAKEKAAKAAAVAAKANVPHVVPQSPRKSPPVSVARSATGPAVAVVRSSGVVSV